MKIILVICFVFGLFFSGLLLAKTTATTTKSHKRFEYHIMTYRQLGKDEETLKQMGDVGWELCAINKFGNWYFKRELK